MSKAKPLVLDVDGTFLKTDMLFECFWAGLGKDPLGTISVSLRNFTNPAVMKRKLVEIANIRTDLLPVNPELKKLAEESRVAGRDVILASASDITLSQFEMIEIIIQTARDRGTLEGRTRAP